jgi:hypothetical protein
VPHCKQVRINSPFSIFNKLLKNSWLAVGVELAALAFIVAPPLKMGESADGCFFGITRYVAGGHAFDDGLLMRSLSSTCRWRNKTQ